MRIPGAVAPDPTEQNDQPPAAEIAWGLASAAVGFAATAIFAGLLALPRDAFVAVYALVVTTYVYSYVRWTGLDVRSFLQQRWSWGAVGAVIFGGLMVASVQRMAASSRAEDVTLAWDILWLGIVYGIADALLLTVLPVTAVWRACTSSGWTATWPGKLAAGAAALAASLGRVCKLVRVGRMVHATARYRRLAGVIKAESGQATGPRWGELRLCKHALVVTAAYHLGYPEFRGPQVVDPLIGNGAMTLGYLLTGNPITAFGAHIALHVASVLHGVETTVTLPPHY